MNGCVAAHKEEILSYVDKLREHIKETHIVARKNMVNQLRDRKTAMTRFIRPLMRLGIMFGVFQRPGDPVFEGPYVITRKLKPLDFQIQVNRFGATRPR